MRPRWAVFISGAGSNLQSLLENISEVPVELVVSSKSSALGLKRARRYGVPTVCLKTPLDGGEISRVLRERQINRIFLLGFMKLLPADFCRDWQGMIWNLHPSLLPLFKGAHAIENSYAAGGEMGISIHEVTAEMDSGKVLKQVRICTSASQELRSLEQSQRLISQAEQRSVQKFATQKSYYFVKDRNVS